MSPRLVLFCSSTGSTAPIMAALRVTRAAARISHCSFFAPAAAIVMASRHHATAAATDSPSSASGFAKPSPSSQKSSASSAPSPPPPPPPPPLSILSWAVDGSGHTHHNCRRRMTVAQRIPLLCETVRRAAPDVVALQDSTAEMAAALTVAATASSSSVSGNQTTKEGAGAGLKVYCAELAEELRHAPQRHTAAAAVRNTEDVDVSAEKAASEDAPSIAAELTSEAEDTSRDSAPCSYRLVGRARNGRCGEVQLFIKADSLWEARLLPGLGAGLSVELISHSDSTLTTSPPAPSPGEEKVETKGGLPDSSSTSSVSAPPTTHRCVLTTLDLSYRGKSLGTHLHGMLSDAAVSADGSPFTLQTPPTPSAAATEQPPNTTRRSGRAAGQLDPHRAIAFDFVHHHVRPDVLVGNVFTGARERVPGFEDAWVRAGSPSGQERTTNTCARHRIDRMTNYFYFCPSRGVASKTAMEKMLRFEEEYETATAEEENAEGQVEGKSSTSGGAAVAVPADAAIGTPIPLNAYVDETNGTWRTPTRDASQNLTQQREAQEAEGTVSTETPPFSDLTTGVPEVAGRFQRCLFRAWVRRGPPSRSGHLSAHPFLRHYKRCRVVVLRPMVEVTLDAQECAWHARNIAAQYNLLHKQRRGRRGESRGVADAAEESGVVEGDRKGLTAEVSEGHDGGDEAEPSPHLPRVPTRVRCSISDQFPLLTILN